jgi:hypothetical protein
MVTPAAAMAAAMVSLRGIEVISRRGIYKLGRMVAGTMVVMMMVMVATGSGQTFTKVDRPNEKQENQGCDSNEDPPPVW